MFKAIKKIFYQLQIGNTSTYIKNSFNISQPPVVLTEN